MIKRFLIALQFLTVLPVKILSSIEAQDFGRSLLYFPLVGLFIGAVLACSATLLNPLPSLVRGALLIIISVVITGAIHLDGLADTCDGFYAGRSSREDILRVMKDSRIGAIGAVGIFCILLLKFALIVSIPQGLLAKALIISSVFSRWAQAFACGIYNYARPQGKAKFFLEYARGSDIAISGAATFIFFLLLFGIEGLILFILPFIGVFGFMTFVRARIGGMTGDTIGAVNEIAEAGVLFMMALKGAL